MLETARWIGGFIHWLLKGCRTKLKDEIEGNLDATWGRTYDTENYVIGYISVSLRPPTYCKSKIISAVPVLRADRPYF